MTKVVQSQSHSPSSSSSSNPRGHASSHFDTVEEVEHHLGAEEVEEEEGYRKKKERDREGDQVSIFSLLVVALRKSMIGCSGFRSGGDFSSMDIGLPSNVRHVSHVTFDRFNGFLGLPAEFEPEVPRRVPSASANIFGVSTESMQLSFDARGNSVPTILLLMQRHLYAQGGLQAEGIFRVNAENSQEEFVREQLNRGIVPDGLDVHCLAGLIKAWFRELPTGLLDSLSPEQVMQAQSEEEYAQLVRLLPQTEATLLDWAINLMADVAQLEHLNKMDARNIAMVFAPNMTQMADPLTALMYAVQVMNFLKTLVMKTLRYREESMTKSNHVSNLDSSGDDGHESSSQGILKDGSESESESDHSEEDTVFVAEEPSLQSHSHLIEGDSESDHNEEDTVFVAEEPSLQSHSHLVNEGGSESETESQSLPKPAAENIRLLVKSFNVVSQLCSLRNEIEANIRSNSNNVTCSRKVIELPVEGSAEKNRRSAMIGLISSRTELAEAWR